MQVIQVRFENSFELNSSFQSILDMNPDMVLVFGAPSCFSSDGAITPLSAALGDIPWIGCSTAGEIYHTGVSENSLVVTALRFYKDVRLRFASVTCPTMDDSRDAGRSIATQLADNDLRGVFMLAPGVMINGSDVIAGARAALDSEVKLSGGLAGDGSAFVKTYTAINGSISDRAIVAVGFYGEHIRIQNGSYGGWKPFGPVRRVSRAKGNVLYQMDSEPALALYRHYLGEYAAGLPSTGLLFPLSVFDHPDSDQSLIRTLIGINEEEGSLIFAGDIPSGSYVRMMQANVNSLVDGAQTAAETAAALMENETPGLALLVSCVGRKLVMAGRTEEEVEVVAQAFGRNATVAGFYSYGEISPGVNSTDCSLHNQTMTVTFIAES